MTREEFIKQRCEIDKITEEEFKKRYRVVKCNCGQFYCKGYRCLDLDGLLRENQELKKQQEEFINYMMNTIENITHDETDDEEIKGYLIQRGNTFKEILSKYKEIIGGKE